MIISLEARKNEKMLEAARAALANESCKPVCQMDTVFMRKCIEIISGNCTGTEDMKKRPSLWESFMAFLCDE